MAVSIAWNAAASRARSLALHRLGSRACRDLAYAGSHGDALERLRRGPYGHDVKPGMTLPAAQWGVAATPLWHMRVLAGWLPPSGAECARVLAGWWEVLNVENLLAGLAGAGTFAPYELGRLDTAWSRLRGVKSLEALRERLAASPWSDPGADDPGAIATWLRLSWAQRLADAADAGLRLAAGWAALVAARHQFLGTPVLPREQARRVRVLGRNWHEAGDLRAFSARLPSHAAWVLEDIGAPSDLWHAERRWWQALDEDARRLLRRAKSGSEAVLGAFGLLLADARRVQAALELAFRAPRGQEAVDEVL